MGNITGYTGEKDKIITAVFRTILENTKDLMFIKDMNLVYVAASMPFVLATGNSSLEDIVGKKDEDIFVSSTLAKKYILDDYKLLENGKDLLDYIEPLPDEDGHPRYGTTSKYILKDEDGNYVGILGITRDITREYIARQRYQVELKYLFELPEDTYAVTYIDISDWRIITQRRQDLNGSTLQSCFSVEEICEAAIASIVDEESEAMQFYKNFSIENLQEIYDSGRTDMSFTYQRKLSDESIHWVQNEVKFLTDIDSGHLCVMLSAKDIDEQKEVERKLVEAAKFDQMTMLYNRETTMEYIKKALNTYPEDTHVLYMIDVDNFKSLNDTMGHQVGDEFLIDLAKELNGVFQEKGVVGRIGGDEFFAFMEKIPDQEIAEQRANEMIHTIRKVCIRYPMVQLSGSVGVSIYPQHGKMIEELYAKADEALYQAKRNGKNQYIIGK